MFPVIENIYYSVNTFCYTTDSVSTTEELFSTIDEANDKMRASMMNILKKHFPITNFSLLFKESDSFTFSIDKIDLNSSETLIIENYDNSIDIYTKTKNYFNTEKTNKLFKFFISAHLLDVIDPNEIKYLTCGW
jgi:hypothetical protein